MDTIYVTDGSWEGLLSAVYDSWYQREDNVLNILPALPTQPDFLITYKTIRTNEAKAEKVFEAMETKLSSQSSQRVMLCWYSEEHEAGRNILNYLRLGFATGPTVDEMVLHRFVRPVHDAADRVAFEAHRMKGLLRFHRTKQRQYCSVIEPDFYILPLLAEHFADRMPDVPWLIHDKGRQISAAYENGQWTLVAGRLVDTVQAHDSEDETQEMWRRYFDAMAIEGRMNPALQRRFMPRRYWKHLVENPTGALAKALQRG